MKNSKKVQQAAVMLDNALKIQLHIAEQFARYMHRISPNSSKAWLSDCRVDVIKNEIELSQI